MADAPSAAVAVGDAVDILDTSERIVRALVSSLPSRAAVIRTYAGAHTHTHTHATDDGAAVQAELLTAGSIEQAYGALVARLELRRRAADAVDDLLGPRTDAHTHTHTHTSAPAAAPKGSATLRAALDTWRAAADRDPAAADAALMFVDQWLAREAPFEPALTHLTYTHTHLWATSHWIVAQDAPARTAPPATPATRAVSDVAAIHNVLAGGERVRVLVLSSDAHTHTHTHTHADAAGPRKDIGLYAMNYGGAYVASCSPTSGAAGVSQFKQAIAEAEAFPGPALVLVHVPAVTGGAVAEGEQVLVQFPAAEEAVRSGAWPLYRHTPVSPDAEEDGNAVAFRVDSGKLRADIAEFLDRENHLALLSRTQPALPSELTASVEADIAARSEAAQKRMQDSYARLVAGLTLPPLLVLYGSDGGNAEAVAKRLVTDARKRGFTEISVKAMDAVPPASLASTPLAVFVVSTAGQGEFPMNARTFWKALSAGVPPEARDVANVPGGTLPPPSAPAPGSPWTALTGLQYAVFGLGDSNYWPKKEQRIFFNKSSADLELALRATGATELVGRGIGDDQEVGGYMTGFKAWLPKLWASLGLGSVAAEEDPSAKTRNPEDVKKTSRYLRGTIAEGLLDESTGALAYEDTLLTKFHGIYQQDDRDARPDRKRRGLEPAFSFMVRVRIPGGVASPAQYLALDSIADRYANGTIRATTRQAIQFHGIIKGVLKASIQGINRALMDTLAACGDVNRNVMCTAAPSATRLYAGAMDFTVRLSDHLTPRTSAYHEIWLEDKLVRGGANDIEPIYGATYLPRKFKIAVAIPPSNDVDVYAHDLGFIAVEDPATGELAGFTITIGGGMGMTHNNVKTYPRLAEELCFADPEQALAVAEAVVTTQRDYGDRANRKHARLKYTVDDRGLEWFREEVQRRCGFPLHPPRAYKFLSNGDRYGWTDAGDDSWNYTLFIQNGRIVDGKAPSTYRLKTGLRVIAESGLVPEFRFTPNQNVILARVPSEQRAAVDGLLHEYGIANSAHSGLRLNSMACVALPTCGLALAESERYLPSLLDKLDVVLEEAGLRDDAITIRMTGCPNGCARPYVAEIGLVGRSPGIYNLYLGAGFAGQRLNKLFREGVDEDGIVGTLRPLIRRYATERLVERAWSTAYEESKNPDALRMAAGHAEPFGEWLIRAGVIRPTVTGKTFHDDLPADVSAAVVPDTPLGPAILAGKSKKGGDAIPE